MKKIILLISILLFSVNLTFADDTSAPLYDGSNIRIGSPKKAGKQVNDHLDTINGPSVSGDFFTASSGGEEGVQNLLFTVARSIKNVFIVLATLFMLILVLKLLFGSNTEEQAKKFKTGVLWATIGIILMQSSYAITTALFDKSVNGNLAYSFSEKIVKPFTRLLEFGAGFAFIAMCLVAFYSIVTANGNDEKVKKGKMTVVYGIVGILLIKLSSAIVRNTYGKINCTSKFGANTTNCVGSENIHGNIAIIISLINWINGFIGILVVLMIIYGGFLLIFSIGDQEKTKKGKAIIKYAIIGMVILSMSYFILTFFILPEASTLVK